MMDAILIVGLALAAACLLLMLASCFLLLLALKPDKFNNPTFNHNHWE